MVMRAPDMVLILGNVCQMREIAEGADDLDRLLRCQLFQQILELVMGWLVIRPVQPCGRLADVFDKVENLVTLLVTHAVAQHASKQANVFLQWGILGSIAYLGRVLAGKGGGGNDVVLSKVIEFSILLNCRQNNSRYDAMQHYDAIYAATQQANDRLRCPSYPTGYETAYSPQAGNMSVLSDNHTLFRYQTWVTLLWCW
jgi:hypothetical protein